MEIYSGKENDKRFRCMDEPNVEASANIVVRLSRDVPRFQNHIIYFDNYYSSVPLAVFFKKERSIFSLGTVSRNRTAKCKFPNKKELKRLKRGETIEKVATWKDIPVCLTFWKDNKEVTLLSFFAGKLPEDIVQRFDRKNKTHVAVTRSFSITEYNKFMGGVDLLRSNIGRSRITMKTRKWYMLMCYHLVDVAVVNC